MVFVLQEAAECSLHVPQSILKNARGRKPAQTTQSAS